MSNKYIEFYKSKIIDRFGKIEKMGNGRSLYYIPSINVNIYFRYSKISNASKNVLKAFYGLRSVDIELLKGRKSFICLITDDETKNMFVPFQHFETDFALTEPSSDGQYKTLTFFKSIGNEIYFANIGKFSAESFFNFEMLLNAQPSNIKIPELSHSEVQSLISSIGMKQGYNIWVPNNDRHRLDFKIVDSTKLISELPTFKKEIDNIISEIDVIWLSNSELVSFYEVEHSTPIYSGLLRFNDVHLSMSTKNFNFNIAAEKKKLPKFGREINRPTFKQNKLIDKVTFREYDDIYLWYYTLTGQYYK